MELIKLTQENLESEHICCAISNNRDCQVASKKAWLKERMEEGLVFLKGDVRGKCFIEYIPAEFAWAPIWAEGYFYIDCLWVSGQLKGKGYSNLLLEACIKDAKKQGKKGLAILSSKKKRGFLADPDYLRYKGFLLADTAKPYFELFYLPLQEHAEKPRFREHLARESAAVPRQGFTLYYDAQCPYPAKYVPILMGIAQERGLCFQAIEITSAMQAQNAPTPFPMFSLYYDGAFLTHEIPSEKKFQKILDKLGL